MREKLLTGILILLCIFALNIAPAAASSVQMQSAALVCYDGEGTLRTAANSEPASACYTLDGLATGLTFSQYQAALQQRATAAATSTKAAPAPTVQPTTAAPVLPTASAPIAEAPAQEPIITGNNNPGMNLPAASEPVDIILNKPVSSSPTAAAENQLATTAPIIEKPTGVLLPAESNPSPTAAAESLTILPLQQDTQAPAYPTETAGSEVVIIPLATEIETTPTGTPGSTNDKPADPTVEGTQPAGTPGSTDDQPASPTAGSTIDPTAEATEPAGTPEPTEQPTDAEPSMPMMMMAMPVIGTVNGVTAVHPANGETYQTTEIAFIWDIDSAGVDTVSTSFTLTLDGANYDVTPSCSLTTCQTSRSVAAGNHSWSVTARAGTLSVTSNTNAFKIAPATAAPAKPVLQGPTGTLQSRTVKMFWLPAANAASYTLSWTSTASGNGTASLIASDQTCKDGTCSLSVTYPADDSYSWTVTAVNPSGSTVSDALNFVITAPTAAPAKPSLILPNGSYTSSSVNFAWAPAANAKTYTLTWKSQWGQTGTKTLAAEDASCAQVNCHVSDIMPALGTYTWFVDAINSAGTTRSDSMSFNIYNNLSKPVPSSPSGTVQNNQPFSFTFKAVEDNAYQYNVTVYNAYNNKQVADYYWNTSDLNCSGGYCTGSASSSLPQGSYYWKVRARSNNSVSDYSGSLSFRNDYCYNCTKTPVYTVNTVPTPYSPIGLSTTDTPTFTWRHITGAKTYWLKIFDASGKILYNGTIDSSACNAQSCSLSPQVKLPGAGNYSWRISGGSNTGVVWNSASATFAYQPQTLTIKSVIPALPIIYPMEQGILNNENARVVWLDPLDTVSGFKVEIHDENKQELLNVYLDREAAWCDKEICQIEFNEIPLDQPFQLTLTPFGRDGNSGESTVLAFSVSNQPLEFKALYPAENQTVGTNAPFIWQLPASLTADQLKNAAFQVQLIDETRKREATFGPFKCEDEALICFTNGALLKPQDTLLAGSYSWKVISDALQPDTATHVFTIN